MAVEFHKIPGFFRNSLVNFDNSLKEINSEKQVYIIDKNGFDLWAGVVKKRTADNSYIIMYPDFPGEEEKIKSLSRILEKSDINHRQSYNVAHHEGHEDSQNGCSDSQAPAPWHSSYPQSPQCVRGGS